MSNAQSEIKAILTRAEETLQTARFGYQDLIGPDRQRRVSGLRNLIVFGRAVTFVIQNLRSAVGDSFDQWYAPEQEMMKRDPLMRYFVEARNAIEKQGRINLSTSATIHSFSTSDLSRFGTPPPGAQGFFIGDQLGGTGWDVQLPDGTEVKYYVELPADIGEVRQHLMDLPELDPTGQPSVEEACGVYLGKLEALLDRANQAFLGETSERMPGSRRPRHLRVVE